MIHDDRCTLVQKGGEYLCMPGACFSLSDSFMLESIVTRSTRVFETRLHGFPSRPGLISERVRQVVHARCIALSSTLVTLQEAQCVNRGLRVHRVSPLFPAL